MNQLLFIYFTYENATFILILFEIYKNIGNTIVKLKLETKNMRNCQFQRTHDTHRKT